MPGDYCPSFLIRVVVHENGILRLADTGRLIGRLIEDDEVSFEKLKAFAMKDDAEKARLEKRLELALSCISNPDTPCPSGAGLKDTEKCVAGADCGQCWREALKEV